MMCAHPLQIKNKYYLPGITPLSFSVPCGHCTLCKIARTREWTIRLMHEGLYWKESVFITLTYSPENVPSDMGLRPSDLTDFFKRLRKRYDFKYYACGEYGDNYSRPHFHAIVFGLSPSHRKEIEDAWHLGFVKVGSVTDYSMRYVCGYLQKKLYGKDARFYKDAGIHPPYSVMSKGLGKEYCLDHAAALKETCTVRYHGHDVCMPRTYREWLDINQVEYWNKTKDVREQEDDRWFNDHWKEYRQCEEGLDVDQFRDLVIDTAKIDTGLYKERMKNCLQTLHPRNKF